MAAQTGLVLVDCRVHFGHAIGRADPEGTVLRSADGGRRKGTGLPRRMGIVAIGTRGVPVISALRAFIRGVFGETAGSGWPGLANS